MNKVLYPSLKSLKLWIGNLEGENPVLKLSLPTIDEQWYERVIDILDMVQMSYYESNIHDKAAIIFYKIIKTHNYIDGNKRSSIIVVYLFYLINGYYIPKSASIRKLAKDIANSKGRDDYDKWIDHISNHFSNHTRLLAT
ncbi:MAG: type II toxin-antitoxin system death-on-curing family toxin [Candidatus Paceibacterota bacterium]